jgi:CubicO group peptidase (beta-lactamase class C family)
VVTPALRRLTRAAARAIIVPEDVAAITDVGDETPRRGVEDIWDRVVDLYRTGVHPGIQLCIRHQGRVVLDRALGHARGVVPGRAPAHDAVVMRTDTPVNLFSAAKAVTAIVMHKLEGDGLLALDEPVARYLPGFERHGKGAITLHQVLTHRAGIPVMPPEALDLDVLDDPAAVLEYVLDLRPAHKAGGPPAYHTVTGGFVMEAVVRQLTGSSLRDVLARDIKRPLGLGWFDYGVASADTHRVAHNVMTGLRLTPALSRFMRRLLGISWDEAVALSNDPRFQAGVIPSANVIATARDTAKVYQCLLDGGLLDGTRVFAPSTVARLAHVPSTRLEIDRMIGMPVRYGNGFMMGSHSISFYGWNHPRAFGHVGMSNTFTWADPDRDLVVALLTTGKPILGPHLLALPRLLAGIHAAFPVRDAAARRRKA